MRLSFAELMKHFRPNIDGPFAALIYEPLLMTVTDAIGLLTCWSLGKETVRDYVQRVGPDGVPPRAQAYAERFDDGPVFLVACTLDTLGRIWPENYLNATGPDLVIIDGCHRSSALAIRELRDSKDDHPVFVFVGE
jgi:hypothetical protein